MEHKEFFLLLAFLISIICGAIAASKGRGPIWLFVLIGFLFPLPTLIVTLCLSKKKELS